MRSATQERVVVQFGSLVHRLNVREQGLADALVNVSDRLSQPLASCWSSGHGPPPRITRCRRAEAVDGTSADPRMYTHRSSAGITSRLKVPADICAMDMPVSPILTGLKRLL